MVILNIENGAGINDGIGWSFRAATAKTIRELR
jgi:hypothetical protein